MGISALDTQQLRWLLLSAFPAMVGGLVLVRLQYNGRTRFSAPAFLVSVLICFVSMTIVKSAKHWSTQDALSMSWFSLQGVSFIASDSIARSIRHSRSPAGSSNQRTWCGLRNLMSYALATPLLATSTFCAMAAADLCVFDPRIQKLTQTVLIACLGMQIGLEIFDSRRRRVQ